MTLHLYESDEPVPEGCDLPAICGQFIPKAKFVYVFDLTKRNQLQAWIDSCPECKARQMWKRFLYGLAAGESIIQ